MMSTDLQEGLRPTCDRRSNPKLWPRSIAGPMFGNRDLGLVAVFVRDVAPAILLIAISSGCISLARMVAPMP